MSDRIHKAVGYGFKVKSETMDSLLNDFNDNLPAADYLDFVKSKLASQGQCKDEQNWVSVNIGATEWVKTSPEGRASNLIVQLDMDEYDEESDETVLLIIPPFVVKDWVHYDDAVDYIEYSLAGKGPENSFIPLDQNPFPYYGKMDKLTGENLSSDIMDILSYPLPDNVAEKWLAKRESIFSSVTELKERAVPSVPLEIRAVAEWLGLFADENSWKMLRPTLLTYWA